MNKKIIATGLCLAFCMNAFLATTSIAASTTSGESSEEDFYVITKDLQTQETSTENISALERSRAFRTDRIDPYIPDSVKPSITPRKIIGSDNRRKVLSTAEHPYSAIGYLETTFENGTRRRGTAFLIHDRVAITAASCTRTQADGGPVSMTFYPGKEGDNNRYGAITVNTVTIPQEYADTFSVEYDWAVLVLASDIGQQTGYVGFRKYNNYNDINGQLGTVSGYPTDKGYYQYYNFGIMENATDNNIDIPIDMTGGMAGSPVYLTNNYAVGVATKEYNNREMNIASRVNEHFFSTALNAVNNN